MFIVHCSVVPKNSKQYVAVEPAVSKYCSCSHGTKDLPLDALHIHPIERMNNSIRTTVQIVSQVVFPRMLLPTSDQLN